MISVNESREYREKATNLPCFKSNMGMNNMNMRAKSIKNRQKPTKLSIEFDLVNESDWQLINEYRLWGTILRLGYIRIKKTAAG